MYARELRPPIRLATAQLISRQIHREIKRIALGELRARFLTLCGRRVDSPGLGDQTPDRTVRAAAAREILQYG